MSELREKTILIVGAGGLGGPAALALAGAGVGRLVLADGAPVEATDLVIQPLFAESDLGRPRDQALAGALQRLFPGLDVSVPDRPLDAPTARDLLRGAQAAVEATNQFPAMFLVNDAAVAAGVPFVHGALVGHTAQLLSVVPGATGCLRCLFEGPPARPEPALPEADPLGPLAGLVGSLLGLEALRLLEGTRGAYAGQLVAYEARSGWSRAVPVRPRPGCPVCAAPARAGPEREGGAP